MKPLFYIMIVYSTGLFYGPAAGVRGIAGTSADKAQLRAVYRAELGVREASGHNDGQRVETYLRYAGLGKGQPWCAAFVCWCLGQCQIENPRSGYCPDLFPSEKVIWCRQGPSGSGLAKRSPSQSPLQPGPGDVFGLYFPEKKRVAHAGFVDEWGDKYLISTEGNTNEAGGREGDGVYRKRRLISSVYCVARYLKKKEVI